MWFFLYFSLHLIVYTLLRFVFLVWNWGFLRNLSTSDIFWAFLNGIRFDLSVLAISVGLCFLGLVWMTGKSLLRRIWINFFIVFNSVLYLINIADIELFNFTAKRFSASAFYMVGEGNVTNYIYPYLGLILVAALLIGGYAYLCIKLSKKFNYKFDLKSKAALTMSVFLVSILCSRGGVQLKPLTFVDAKLFENSYANNLVLNSSFTILKSLGHNSLQKVSYFKNDEMLSLLNAQDIKPVEFKTKKMNVVVLVLESFSQEYLSLRNPEATPFLNRLQTKGLVFDNTFANGRRSIEGMAAILSGIPALMEEPFINSEFSANQIIGIGTLLASSNYHTSFFHGSANGSMHFDRFTKSVGISNYFGLNEYPEKSDNDGTWGIYDEPFLNWTCNQLTGFNPPFFTTIFTLSSHQPYNLPQKYQDRFVDERAPILKSVRYTDFAVEQFMKCAEKQSWYKDTIFVVTADHTGPPLNADASFQSRYRIPLIFFSSDPTFLNKIDHRQLSQQIDILPTLLDLLGIEHKNRNFLSRSLLQSGPKIVVLYADGQYELVGDVKDKDRQLKAVQQYFSEGLYDNRLYFPNR